MRPGHRSLKKFREAGLARRDPLVRRVAFARLTYDQRRFVSAYLNECRGDATAACRKLGYADPVSSAYDMMRNREVIASIEQAMVDAGLTEEAIVGRLEDIAHADLSDVLDVGDDGRVSLAWKRARRRDRTKLVKSITLDGEGRPRRVEMHDAAAALVALGKVKGIFQADRRQSDQELVLNVTVAPTPNAALPGPEEFVDIEPEPDSGAPENGGDS